MVIYRHIVCIEKGFLDNRLSEFVKLCYLMVKDTHFLFGDSEYQRKENSYEM